MIEVQLWGAGGGGGWYSPTSGATTVNFGGGAGGYTTCSISVTPGTQLTVLVGQGGSGYTETY